MVNFEYLSNEILYEIFEYLHGFEIFHAFTSLNERFNGLIYYSAQSIRFSQSSLFNGTPRQNHAQFIIDNSHRTISLSIPNGFYLLTVYDRARTNSAYHHLESVSIDNISYPYVLQLLAYFKTLPRLFSLTIVLNQHVNDLTEIYRSVFALPALKYAKLSPSNEQPLVSLPLKIRQPSKIEHLVLNHAFQSVDDLLRILSCTPQITRLTCKRVLPGTSQTKNLLVIPCRLQYLSLDECILNSEQLNTLIRRLCSHCQTLRINTCTHDRIDLAIQQWEQLILQSMPQLTELDLHHQLNPYDPDNILSLVSTVNHSLSSFWTQRKVTLKVRIDHDESLHAVFHHSFEPPDRPWYQLEANANNTQQKSSAARFSQLCCDLPTVGSTKYLPIHQICLEPLFALFQCNSLYLHLDKFCISTVLQCLNRWWELDSLRIAFKECDEPAGFYPEENQKQNDHSEYKITKLSVEQFLTFDQLIPLINVCVDLSHFQFKCRTITDAEWLLRYISTEQKSNRFRHLRFLSIWYPLADEKTVEILHDFIDTEQLLDDQTTKRIGERIYIEWKKGALAREGS